jgi:hypothetical protein
VEFLALAIEKLVSSTVLWLTQGMDGISDKLWLLKIGKIVLARNRMQRLMNIADEVDDYPQGLDLREL